LRTTDLVKSVNRTENKVKKKIKKLSEEHFLSK